MDLEILLYNYWEHVKAEKDLARVLPPEHKRRMLLNESINEIAAKINSMNVNINNSY